jgi:hypothetical protein
VDQGLINYQNVGIITDKNSFSHWSADSSARRIITGYRGVKVDTDTSMKTVFRNGTPCSLVGRYWRFGKIRILSLQNLHVKGLLHEAKELYNSATSRMYVLKKRVGVDALSRYAKLTVNMALLITVRGLVSAAFCIPRVKVKCKILEATRFYTHLKWVR